METFKKINYETIINSRIPLFFDCSALQIQNWFAGSLKDARFYEQVSGEALSKEIAYLRQIAPLILDDKKEIFFIPGVIGEFAVFLDRIDEKFRSLKRTAVSKEDERKRGLLEEIKTLCEIIHEHSALNPYFQEYSARFKEYRHMLIKLAKKYKLKDKPFLPKKERQEELSKKSKKRSHVDEELLASAMVYSLEYATRCCVVTRDGDFKLILQYGLDYLVDSEKYPAEVKAFKESPIMIYELNANLLTESDSKIKNRLGLIEQCKANHMPLEKVVL